MQDEETIKKDEKNNTTGKADNFDKEKEVTAVSKDKSIANNNNAANDEVMKKQKETD
jgi:hypothetical protein